MKHNHRAGNPPPLRLLLSACVSLLLAAAFLLPLRAGGAAPAVAPPGGMRLPILMYHSVVDDPSRCGAYVITPGELEGDLDFLRSRGYTAVTVADLLDYVYEGTELPEKPVMLTFDDGYCNNYLYAYPLLKKYGMKAVLSVIGVYTDRYSASGEANPLYSHVTWKQVVEMSDSGIVEIQNHSYDMHTITDARTASKIARGETIDHYRAVLAADAVRLQSLVDLHTRRLPTAYTYPFGLVSRESAGILREIGFRATLSCSSGVNTLSRDPQCLYLLKRLLRPHGTSAKALFERWMGGSMR